MRQIHFTSHIDLQAFLHVQTWNDFEKKIYIYILHVIYKAFFILLWVVYRHWKLKIPQWLYTHSIAYTFKHLTVNSLVNRKNIWNLRSENLEAIGSWKMSNSCAMPAIPPTFSSFFSNKRKLKRISITPIVLSMCPPISKYCTFSTGLRIRKHLGNVRTT